MKQVAIYDFLEKSTCQNHKGLKNNRDMLAVRTTVRVLQHSSSTYLLKQMDSLKMKPSKCSAFRIDDISYCAVAKCSETSLIEWHIVLLNISLCIMHLVTSVYMDNSLLSIYRCVLYEVASSEIKYL